MNSSFFAMLGRMKHIARWGLMHSTRQENLSEHTLEVAYIAHGLAVLGNRRFNRQLEPGKAVLYALYHDCSEILTGDLPTPVKYRSEALRAAYKAVEAEAAGRLLEKLPEELTEDFAPWFQIPPDYAPIIKAADKLSALIKCQEEKNSGNRRFNRQLEPGKAVLYALYHDCSEILTGDLPTPVKYRSEALRAAYKAVEAEAAGRLLEKLPEELTEDFAPWFQIPPDYAPIIKAADKLSALIKCQEEKNSGNREFDRAMETTLASLREMALPEADAFLEEFFPAYSLTLDDQAL